MKIIGSLLCMILLMLLGDNVDASSSRFTSTKLTTSSPIQNMKTMRAGGGKKNKLTSEPKVIGGPLQTFLQTVKDSKNHLAAAAAARSVSIFGMFPVGRSSYFFSIFVFISI